MSLTIDIPVRPRRARFGARYSAVSEFGALRSWVDVPVKTTSPPRLPPSGPRSTIQSAFAARTKRIRLTSAVTVLSAADPVRVFQEFATLDLISGGRAEMIVGRGSFIEAFPLFGYKLEDYDSLFADKLELLLEIRGMFRDIA